MIAFAAFLAFAAAPASVPVAPEAGEIVVIGQKLNDWRGTWGSNKGIMSCKTTRSTGDADIDAIGCEALVTCASPLLPQLQAIAAAKLPKKERERQMDAARQSMASCLGKQRQAGIAALADRRAGG